MSVEAGQLYGITWDKGGVVKYDIQHDNYNTFCVSYIKAKPNLPTILVGAGYDWNQIYSVRVSVGNECGK